MDVVEVGLHVATARGVVLGQLADRLVDRRRVAIALGLVGGPSPVAPASSSATTVVVSAPPWKPPFTIAALVVAVWVAVAAVWAGIAFAGPAATSAVTVRAATASAERAWWSR